jgi:hypothetical protein
VKGLSLEEFKKKFADWRTAVQAAGAAVNSAGTDEKARAKARAKYSKVYERRGEFMHEDVTGFVWLYLQK